jgi:hypothetical protein
MPTSMFPGQCLNVPKKIIRLSEANSVVLCNLRPGQREKPKTEDEKLKFRISLIYDKVWVYEPLRTFLKEMLFPTKIALLYQGYGKDILTSVINLESVYWTNEAYPRLNFHHPRLMNRFIGPNFWGAFILAIAKVPKKTKIFSIEDPKSQEFVKAIKAYCV